LAPATPHPRDRRQGPQPCLDSWVRRPAPVACVDIDIDVDVGPGRTASPAQPRRLRFAASRPCCFGGDAVVMVVLVRCCDVYLHLDAGRMVLPTQPRRRLPPLMHCELNYFLSPTSLEWWPGH
jgi:hypothetical protein